MSIPPYTHIWKGGVTSPYVNFFGNTVHLVYWTNVQNWESSPGVEATAIPDNTSTVLIPGKTSGQEMVYIDANIAVKNLTVGAPDFNSGYTFSLQHTTSDTKLTIGSTVSESYLTVNAVLTGLAYAFLGTVNLTVNPVAINNGYYPYICDGSGSTLNLLSDLSYQSNSPYYGTVVVNSGITLTFETNTVSEPIISGTGTVRFTASAASKTNSWPNFNGTIDLAHTHTNTFTFSKTVGASAVITKTNPGVGITHLICNVPNADYIRNITITGPSNKVTLALDVSTEANVNVTAPSIIMTTPRTVNFYGSFKEFSELRLDSGSPVVLYGDIISKNGTGSIIIANGKTIYFRQDDTVATPTRVAVGSITIGDSYSSLIDERKLGDNNIGFTLKSIYSIAQYVRKDNLNLGSYNFIDYIGSLDITGNLDLQSSDTSKCNIIRVKGTLAAKNNTTIGPIRGQSCIFTVKGACAASGNFTFSEFDMYNNEIIFSFEELNGQTIVPSLTITNASKTELVCKLTVSYAGITFVDNNWRNDFSYTLVKSNVAITRIDPYSEMDGVTVFTPLGTAPVEYGQFSGYQYYSNDTEIGLKWINNYLPAAMYYQPNIGTNGEPDATIVALPSDTDTLLNTAFGEGVLVDERSNKAAVSSKLMGGGIIDNTAAYYVDSNGLLIINKTHSDYSASAGIEISLQFLRNSGVDGNMLAYYIIDGAEDVSKIPKSVNDIKELVILLPNTTSGISSGAILNIGNITSQNVTTVNGKQFRSSTISSYLNKGTTTKLAIGFVLINRGWNYISTLQDGVDTIGLSDLLWKNTTIGSHQGYSTKWGVTVPAKTESLLDCCRFSQYKLNNYPGNNDTIVDIVDRAHYIHSKVVIDGTTYSVISIEDGQLPISDRDYNDVAFLLKITPIPI